MTLIDPPALKATDSTSLADTLRPALLRLSRRLRQEGLKSGLSAHDAILLGYVNANPGVGVSALADAEQTSRPTMSAHLKRLELAGFLSRDEHASDGRRCGFTLTAAGRRKLDQIRAERNDWLARQLSKLDPEERAQLAAVAGPLLKLAAVAS